LQEQKWLIGIILMVPTYTITSVIILTVSDCTCTRALSLVRFSCLHNYQFFFWRIHVIWKVVLRIDSDAVPFRVGLSLHHYALLQSRSTAKLWAIATKRLRYTPSGSISLLAWVCKSSNLRLFEDSFFSFF